MVSRFLFLTLPLFFAAQVAADPEIKVIDGVTYHVLRASAESIRVVWKDAKGNQLRTFPEVARYLERAGIAVDTLMNGGIFEAAGIPSGLMIQDGRTLRPVNREEGVGNFFLKPNGIFLLGPRGAAVIRTEEYPIRDMEIHQAVQSGPLLLRNGEIHPQFNAGSTSRLHRNGVGVSRDGWVVFAMTDFHSPKFPNLFEFTQFFHHLGCDDALFLDGDLSRLYSKPTRLFA